MEAGIEAPQEFELTGETRKVQPGEWFLTATLIPGAQQAPFSGTLLPWGERQILRPKE